MAKHRIRKTSNGQFALERRLGIFGFALEWQNLLTGQPVLFDTEESARAALVSTHPQPDGEKK
jgi:hypothetical protein